ncbi:hypothetical protein, partial [Aminipila sp.]|uniref:hypothetical protein n=1 Tax=Aminipila sp. TaxID=2060095 RepID=UPI00289C54AB
LIAGFLSYNDLSQFVKQIVGRSDAKKSYFLIAGFLSYNDLSQFVKQIAGRSDAKKSYFLICRFDIMLYLPYTYAEST